MYSNLKSTERRCSRLEENTNNPDNTTNKLTVNNIISLYSLNKTYTEIYS